MIGRFPILPIVEVAEVKTGWNNTQLRLQQKVLGINIYKLDLRLWQKNEDNGNFYPLRNGICLENELWRENVIPEMMKFLDKYEDLYDYSGRYKIKS